MINYSNNDVVTYNGCWLNYGADPGPTPPGPGPGPSPSYSNYKLVVWGTPGNYDPWNTSIILQNLLANNSAKAVSSITTHYDGSSTGYVYPSVVNRFNNGEVLTLQVQALHPETYECEMPFTISGDLTGYGVTVGVNGGSKLQLYGVDGSTETLLDEFDVPEHSQPYVYYKTF